MSAIRQARTMESASAGRGAGRVGGANRFLTTGLLATAREYRADQDESQDKGRPNGSIASTQDTRRLSHQAPQSLPYQV